MAYKISYRLRPGSRVTLVDTELRRPPVGTVLSIDHHTPGDAEALVDVLWDQSCDYGKHYGEVTADQLAPVGGW